MSGLPLDTEPKRILAFLQNMWFKDPEAARRIFERHPDRRNQLIGTYLFMGCLTGRRLEQTFGNLCDEIIWEECSPHIGGKSSAAFPADDEHMKAAIRKYKPNIILAFGKIASTAINYIRLNPEFVNIVAIHGPHPAARYGAVEGLKNMHEELKRNGTLGY